MRRRLLRTDHPRNPIEEPASRRRRVEISCPVHRSRLRKTSEASCLGARTAKMRPAVDIGSRRGQPPPLRSGLSAGARALPHFVGEAKTSSLVPSLTEPESTDLIARTPTEALQRLADRRNSAAPRPWPVQLTRNPCGDRPERRRGAPPTNRGLRRSGGGCPSSARAGGGGLGASIAKMSLTACLESRCLGSRISDLSSYRLLTTSSPKRREQRRL